jgi:DNA-binding beta-propeller fold protein YncE
MREIRFVLCAVLALGFGACSDSPGVTIPGADAGDPGGGPDGDGGDFVPLPPLGDGVGTLAGQAFAGMADGSRDQALFFNPVNVIVTPDGDILVADFDNGALRLVTPEGDVSTLVGGDPAFSRPFGMAFTSDGALIVQTDWNTAGRRGGTLWRMNAAGTQRSVIAEDVGRYRGLAALPDGRVAMADYQAHTVSLLDPATGSITTLAGVDGAAGYVDGSGAGARFSRPYDLVLGSDGALIVSDQGNHRLRRVTLAGEVSTFAGNGQAGVSDGDRMSAGLNEPQALAIDDAGTIYVTSRGGYVLRAIEPSGQVSTISGDGSPGWLDSEDPMRARFFGLEGLAVTGDGQYLYISDGSRGEPDPYHRVRRQKLR